MVLNALGMIETNSIPAGIEAGDAMLKAADVSLASAQPVCAGKYIVIVSGSVAAVEAAVAAGVVVAAEVLVDSIVIPNVHEQVIQAIGACSEVFTTGALGLIETFSLASAVICADAAVKAANVNLIEIRLGRGLGGKSFITMIGEVSAVRFAVQAAENLEEAKGMVARTVVIPSPHPDMLQAIF
ncbi:MAG: BMC domain-containing protein [Christensenella sp.]|nr:BMC domain-containing protein [Christensenella sp.]